MSENNISKHNQQLIRNLFSNREEVVLSVIKEMRNSGNPRLVSAVLTLYLQTDSERISQAIIALIRDMKNQSAVHQLFPMLQDIPNMKKKQSLVAACWQSGLDFSEHLQAFLHIFLEDDYMTALEAFSVIENSLTFLRDKQSVEGNISFLKEHIPPKTSEKILLYKELVKILEETSEQF